MFLAFNLTVGEREYEPEAETYTVVDEVGCHSWC